MKKGPTKKLSINDLEKLVSKLRTNLSAGSEDIPPFSTCNQRVLQSCLAQIDAGFGSKKLFPSKRDKASWLLYGIIKNHPFQNGNKRIAIYTFIEFIKRNSEVELNLSDLVTDQLFYLAIDIAMSPAESQRPQLVKRAKAVLELMLS